MARSVCLSAVVVTLVSAACKTENTPRESDPATPAWSDWSLTDTGFGPIVAGMTPTEANTAAGGTLRLPESSLTTGCDYASAPAVEGLAFMIQDGRIVRIEVRQPGPKTAEGAAVGDTEERVLELYAGRITSSPHKYTAGHYLTTTSRVGSRGTTVLIFETDSGRVTKFRGGLLPQVAYVEGCG